MKNKTIVYNSQASWKKVHIFKQVRNLNLGNPKTADSETRAYMQIVYLRNDCSEQEWGAGRVKKKKRRENQQKDALCSYRQMKSGSHERPSKGLWKMFLTHLPKDWKKEAYCLMGCKFTLSGCPWINCLFCAAASGKQEAGDTRCRWGKVS